MSVAVSLADLPAATERQIGWCYLLTVSDKGQARVLAIAPQWVLDDTALRADVGRGTAENAAERSLVSLVWPPADAGGYSLIADGVAHVEGLTLTFTPTSAVLHRPAISDGDS